MNCRVKVTMEPVTCLQKRQSISLYQGRVFQVSADLTSEILTERSSGKQVLWNWQSKFLKNTYKEVNFKLQVPVKRLFGNKVFITPTPTSFLQVTFPVKFHLATLTRPSFKNTYFLGYIQQLLINKNRIFENLLQLRSFLVKLQNNFL